MKIFTRTCLLMAAMLWLLSTPQQAQALLASHDCSFCHDFHGGPGYSQLLTAENSELVCLTCHTVSINGTAAAAPHNPQNLASDQPGYITCRECHNPHDNVGSNIKLIGYKFDPETNQRFSVPTIREELTTSDPGSPVFKEVTFATTAEPNADFNRSDGKGSCQVCHTTNHLVGADCTTCHNHEDDFGSGPEGFPADGECTDCHTGTGTSTKGGYSYDAFNVGPGSPHTVTTVGGVFNACTDCHPGHSTTPSVVVPNNADVGINYSANGEAGIALGGTATNGTIEAQICWDCHDQNNDGDLDDAGDISEWGLNTDTNGTFPNFDTGSLSGAVAPAWVNSTGTTGATWASANFQYKTDAIQSTHAANPTAGVAGLDAQADIRCSYCHDVHQLNLATGDATTGKPYLRGTWMGNPYREDGAPRWDGVGQDRHTYAENQTYGAVPRGNRGPYTSHDRVAGDSYVVEMGGYWIDQNSGFPTRNASYDTATKTAGLCELCHGGGGGGTRGDAAWAAAEVNNIDQFVGTNWLGTNGHANSVISGGGIASGNAANIFTNAKRGNAGASFTVDSLGSRQGTTDSGGMGYFGWASSSRLWGLRNNDEDSWYDGASDRAKGVFPMAENPSEWGDGRRAFHSVFGSGFEWGNWWVGTDPDVTQNNTTTDDRYHQFTCSKCHNPHASRLPRLMITNCLDVRLNTWDNQTTFDGREGYAGDSDWTDGGRSDGFDYTINMVQAPGNQELAYANSAQNCHRAVSNTTGWNTITPVNGPGGAW